MSELLPQEGLGQSSSSIENNKNETVSALDINTAKEAANAQQIETGQTTSSPSGGSFSNLQTSNNSQLPDDASQQSGALPVLDSAILPAIADDADLIEKEWVIRAKHIVHQTREDPYNQNKEVNKIKAEYLKKRYNKDIKQT